MKHFKFKENVFKRPANLLIVEKQPDCNREGYNDVRRRNSFDLKLMHIKDPHGVPMKRINKLIQNCININSPFPFLNVLKFLCYRGERSKNDYEYYLLIYA